MYELCKDIVSFGHVTGPLLVNIIRKGKRAFKRDTTPGRYCSDRHIKEEPPTVKGRNISVVEERRGPARETANVNRLGEGLDGIRNTLRQSRPERLV